MRIAQNISHRSIFQPYGQRLTLASSISRNPLYEALCALKSPLVDRLRSHFPAEKKCLYLCSLKLRPGNASVPALSFSVKDWLTEQSFLSDHKEKAIAQDLGTFIFTHPTLQPRLKSWKPTAHEKKEGMSLSLFLFVPGRPPFENLRSHREVFAHSTFELRPFLQRTFAQDPKTHLDGRPERPRVIAASELNQWDFSVRYRHPLLQKSPIKLLLREKADRANATPTYYEPVNPARGRMQGILLSHPDLQPAYDAWAKTKPADDDLSFDYLFPLA